MVGIYGSFRFYSMVSFLWLIYKVGSYDQSPWLFSMVFFYGRFR